MRTHHALEGMPHLPVRAVAKSTGLTTSRAPWIAPRHGRVGESDSRVAISSTLLGKLNANKKKKDTTLCRSRLGECMRCAHATFTHLHEVLQHLRMPR
jgi:hypothetical protein